MPHRFFAALAGVAIAALASLPAAAQVIAPGSSLWRPADVALDAQDNIYIADMENHRILKVRDGVVTSIAGTGEAGYSGDGGPAIRAWLNTPQGVSVDGAGNVYIADTSNHRVRKVSPTGTISTIAGTGTAGYNGDGSAATSRQLNHPTGVSVDGSGNVYIADRHNHRVRRVSAAGAISTFAGTGVEGNIWGTDGPQAATTVQLAQPTDVAVGGDGYIYIADRRSSKVRKVSTAGSLRTHYTERDSTRLWGVAVDGDSNVYVADWTPTGGTYSLIRRITAAGSHSIFAGYGGSGRASAYLHGFRGDGGPATSAATTTSALLDLPRGVAVDSSGNVYIADTDNYRIRKVDAGTGNISTVVSTYGPDRTVVRTVFGTFAGGAMGFAGDGGPAESAQLNEAEGVTVDSSGNVYIADTDNHRIRRVDAGTGNISTIAGTGTAGYGGDGGAANQAQINAPKGVHVDMSGNIYIADTSNHRIRMVSATGTISTIAGNGTQGFSGDGGAATSSMLWWPADVATDASGNIYIADWGNSRIRKIDAAGTISTIAANTGYSPAVAADASGNVYFPFGNRVNKVDGRTGVHSTFAGNGQASSRGSFGGPRLSASLWDPAGVEVDASGNVYVTTGPGRRVYKVLAGSGIITLVAGSGVQGFGGDGGLATSAQFENIHGVAVDPSGNNVYIADFGNNRIRHIRYVRAAPERPRDRAPVERPPEVLTDLADASLDVGETLDIDLGGAFRDPEDGPLSYEAFSSDPGVASASAEDGALRIEALAIGAAEVRVTATDSAGLSASQSFTVRVGVAISFAADASAREGGTIRLALVANRPAPRDLAVAYVLRAGSDPASAADASDHDGGSGGTVRFPAGATRAELAIGIADDDLAEPLREFFTASLTPPAADAGYVLDPKTTATATIEEGVCDRAAPLRDILRGRRDCAAVDDLSQLRVLNLAGRGVSALRPEDFLELSGLRVLDLSNNRLSAWPSAALAGLPQLISLRLGGNRLEALPAGALAAHPQLLSLDLSGNRLSALDGEAFAGLSSLRWLRLNGNLLSGLPAGLFAGVSGLEVLQLQDNPGSPFVLRLELTRADGALWAPGPASLAARVVEGAPFALRSVLKASGGVLPEAGVALAVPAGAVTSEAAAVPQDGASAVVAQLDGAPPVPDDECEVEADLLRPCFQGIATAVGAPLILFKRPPGAAGPIADRTLQAGDAALRLALSDWFDAAPGEALRYAAQSSEPSAVRARIEDGELLLSPLAEGMATVTVTATDAYGLSATVRFEVQVTRVVRSRWQGWRLILLEPEGGDGR